MIDKINNHFKDCKFSFEDATEKQQREAERFVKEQKQLTKGITKGSRRTERSSVLSTTTTPVISEKPSRTK